MGDRLASRPAISLRLSTEPVLLGVARSLGSILEVMSVLVKSVHSVMMVVAKFVHSTMAVLQAINNWEYLRRHVSDEKKRKCLHQDLKM
jgi:hypothetical protein